MSSYFVPFVAHWEMIYIHERNLILLRFGSMSFKIGLIVYVVEHPVIKNKATLSYCVEQTPCNLHSFDFDNSVFLLMLMYDIKYYICFQSVLKV